MGAKAQRRKFVPTTGAPKPMTTPDRNLTIELFDHGRVFSPDGDRLAHWIKLPHLVAAHQFIIRDIVGIDCHITVPTSWRECLTLGSSKKHSSKARYSIVCFGRDLTYLVF